VPRLTAITFAEHSAGPDEVEFDRFAFDQVVPRVYYAGEGVVSFLIREKINCSSTCI